MKIYVYLCLKRKISKPGQYPEMIAPQLTGRLLAVLDRNSNIQKLIKQCDEEGPKHNALVPTYHCMHTPGGPLKFSLEGHPFAVFAFRLTSDYRYIVSVSNHNFITFQANSGPSSVTSMKFPSLVIILVKSS